MRLSTRIALAVGVTVPLLVLASGALLIRLVTKDLHQEQDAHLRQRAAAVTKDARALLRSTANDRPAAVEQARQQRLLAAALDVGIRLTGPDGTVAAGPRPAPSVPLPASAAVPVTVSGGGESWRVLSVPVSVRRPAVTGTLWVFSPDSSARAQIALVRRRVVRTALLAAPVGAAVAWAVVSGAARPLRRLQRRAGGLDPTTSTARLEHARTGITEVDELARTLQTVLARYDQQAARTAEALATARSFSAAASHELRTPLMSMRTNLDILTDHPALDPADRAEVLDDLRREHGRLLGLLVMLRALAQGDLVEADAFGPVDLAEVVDASVADLRRRHPDAAVTVHGAPACGLWVFGWEQGLRSVVDNLLTNARVHGGGTAVDVTLRPSRAPGAPAAVLTVDDTGPGVPPEQRQAVFQRFHRRPGSPGSGLGLTLIAQQVALHRGRVAVLDRPNGRGGARFEVRLPLLAVDGTVDGAATATLPLLRRDWLGGPQEFHKDGA